MWIVNILFAIHLWLDKIYEIDFLDSIFWCILPFFFSLEFIIKQDKLYGRITRNRKHNQYLLSYSFHISTFFGFCLGKYLDSNISIIQDIKKMVHLWIDFLVFFTKKKFKFNPKLYYTTFIFYRHHYYYSR